MDGIQRQASGVASIQQIQLLIGRDLACKMFPVQTEQYADNLLDVICAE